MVMTAEKKGKQAVLNYPCSWAYTVIGSDRALMERAIGEVFQERSCHVSLSRTSAVGSYCSLRVEATVYSDVDRTELFSRLSSHGSITIVL